MNNLIVECDSRYSALVLTLLLSFIGTAWSSLLPVFSFVFGCWSSVLIVASWAFPYRLIRNGGRSALIFSMLANNGRKIGTQATTIPRFLSSLIFRSAWHMHHRIGDRITYTDHKPYGTQLSLLPVSYDAWVGNRMSALQYVQVGSGAVISTMILFPVPQAAVL